MNSRRAICIPSGVVLGLAVSEAGVYEEPIALGTGEILNSRHHLPSESYTHSYACGTRIQIIVCSGRMPILDYIASTLQEGDL